MERPRIRFVKLRPGALAPRYMSEGAAGMDLASAASEPIAIPRRRPGRRADRAGVRDSASASRGRCARARGWRASSASACPTRPGTIDADYRGEVAVLLVNWGSEPFVVNPGDRVAQLVIAPVAIAELEEAAALSDTVRGAGGFGHTG